MTRKKVKLAFITNDSARKATFKKRKKGLMKKVSELSTLCDIEACAIIYSPYDSQPEAWPSPAGVQHVLSKFRDLSEMEQTKKMMNQESFLRQRITKANEQLKKQCKENREKEMTQVMYQSLTGKGLHNLNMADLNDLGWLIDHSLKDISKRIDELNKGSNSQGFSAAAAAVAMVPPEAVTKSGENLQVERPGPQTNVDTMQRIMDMINPQEHVGFGGFTDDALNFNAFFP
ncbi:Transcription factor, MADS-box [Corchorus capsularis]|uniref:Transcription factor, MADS-box n=1 Tax=Corchorus capsularis TaxID=210143 RepID=A0A1R3JE99_COCAP|nr:Transcription factor, MADS-box [Corchorus capsularis]